MIYNIYYGYLKFKKQNESSAFQNLKNNKINLIFIALFLLLSILAMLSNLGILLSSFRSVFLVLLILSVFAIWIFSDKNDIKNSNTKHKNTVDTRKNLYNYLKTDFNIDSLDKIKNLQCKLNKEIQEFKDKKKNTFSTIFKFMQIIIIPIVVCVLSFFFTYDTEKKYLIPAEWLEIMIAIFIFCLICLVMLFICISLGYAIEGKRYEKYKYFLEELQDIIDFELYKNNKNKTKETKK